MIFQLGGLLQLANDIFDACKDIQNGVHTLMSVAEHVDAIRVLFMHELKETFLLAGQTGYDGKNIKAFLRTISLAVCSRTQVCLDRYEEAEERSGNLFAPEDYSRKELICDMERPGNLIRSVKYYLNTNFRIYNYI